MEDSELWAVVTRPLSPDSRVEVPATVTEFLRVQEILEEEDVRFPRVEYDGDRKVAIVVAAPSPCHGEMAGGLTSRIYDAAKSVPGLDANIRGRIYSSFKRSNLTNRGDTFTKRNWDGAIRYRSLEGNTKMVAVEVGLSQSYESLRAAISYSVSALRCSLGIAMCITEGDRGATPPKDLAIEQAELDLKAEVRNNPYGPLVLRGCTLFGRVSKVLLETFRQGDDTCLPNTLLNPTQSFVIVQDGHYAGHDVPPNLAEVTLGDCIPPHILTGNSIRATPLNFLDEEWFEEIFQIAIFETAVERFSDKHKVQPA
ncbi:hypothetical protein POJ06DRAFT_283742 [Lipomyces tetrasporus]|uniref:Uncharacterized protein n=1 Tax=Lipomyces tetrasporus TaxID=54092 RepID=A0AAD7VQG4_9ASCO|nr:uncharacterized protein POJ06DRAFT_283742 [Lipomyces tetrasporus]KAJ8097135.1 hypothetical protein POJ06DRAFT_283742 [Lipomyces tetrasporus]